VAPNGDVAVGGVPIPIPTDPSFFTDPVGTFLGFFGFGGSGIDENVAQIRENQRQADFANAVQQRIIAGLPLRGAEDVLRFSIVQPQLGAARIAQGRDPTTGRFPIPTPAEGGPPLVTERFADLPGPVVDPGLGILGGFELRGIPEPVFGVSQFPAPIPRPIPEPDVLEEAMAVDAPLLAGFGSLLPAIRQAAPATIGGFLGSVTEQLIPALFSRAPQEIGLGQVPQIAARQICPPGVEKPSTRILRMIKQNTGVSVKLTRAKALIRELGLQNAARCLGIGAQEACALLIAASPRRRRGISGSDIRIVKRTARRFESLKHALGHLGGRAAPHHARRKRHVVTHK